MRRGGWPPLALPLAIVAAAAALRLWRLDVMPLGLHNDEAWTGINAREVLRDGWVGPYLYPSGLGQPAGPVYFAALLLAILPETAWTLRASMALIGVATVAFTYLALRAMFGRPVGLFAAALLATLPWHLHLSRTAFMVGSWPCVEMAALWALFRTRAQPSAWRFAGVGLLVGLGIYTYNAYALFVPVIGVPFLYDLAAAADAPARRRWRAWSTAAALTALWAVLPMLVYAATHEEYFWHHRDVSLFASDRWRQAEGLAEHVQLFAARAEEWVRGLLAGGRPDAGDALAEHGHPLLDPLTAGAAAAGLVMALRRWRRPEYGVLLAAVAVLPWGALLTTDDGLYRRTFGLAPFLAALAALPLAALWEWARAARRPLRIAIPAAALLAMTAAAARNVWAYFGPLQESREVRYVYPYQLQAAFELVATLPADTVVYLYSERWAARFETIRWLAPAHQVVDRSREFRTDRDAGAPLDLDADPARPAAFVLLGPYMDLVDALRARYPDATVREQLRGDELLGRVVAVPPRRP